MQSPKIEPIPAFQPQDLGEKRRPTHARNQGLRVVAQLLKLQIRDVIALWIDQRERAFRDAVIARRRDRRVTIRLRPSQIRRRRRPVADFLE
jgi:hypothetical protein